MPHQGELLRCGVQFLTRLPVRSPPDFQPSWINRSARYFSLIGQFVGLLSGVVLLITAKFWPIWIAAALALLTGAIITGALHEDGLADTADGFGGGHDPAHRLAIMKDSRIGTYGALALSFCTLLKLASLIALTPWLAACSLIAAHGVARAATVAVMHALPYAGDPASAKITTQNLPPTRGEALFAMLSACWPFLLLQAANVLLGLAICTVLTVVLARLANRLIGGQRGDVLGAVEQLCEAGFLLGCAAHFGTLH